MENSTATRATDVSSLLRAWRGGDARALDALMPLVHDELRRIASRHLFFERADHSLDATDLVHEAYLRLADKAQPQWQDRVHFYAVAAQIMRRVLVDHARNVRAAKRGGGVPRLPLDEALDAAKSRAAEVIALDDALCALADIDTRKSRMVELRYFGGLSIEETAEALGIAPATVNKHTRLARAWLGAFMRGDAPSP